MQNYPALIRKEAESDFGVEFPDFPGCVTAAEDLAGAMSLSVEALRLHVAGMIEDGEVIPEPSSLEQVIESAEVKGAAACLVPLWPQKSKSIRINVTIDEVLLEALDALAQRQGTSRSAFLAAVVRAKLERDGESLGVQEA